MHETSFRHHLYYFTVSFRSTRSTMNVLSGPHETTRIFRCHQTNYTAWTTMTQLYAQGCLLTFTSSCQQAALCTTKPFCFLLLSYLHVFHALRVVRLSDTTQPYVPREQKRGVCSFPSPVFQFGFFNSDCLSFEPPLHVYRNLLSQTTSRCQHVYSMTMIAR